MRMLMVLVAIASTMTVEAIAQCPTCGAFKRGVIYSNPVLNYSSPVMTTYQQGSAIYQGSTNTMVASSGGSIVNRDSRAYAHAQQEANILASRGTNYHTYSDGGHPLGVAPGCRYSGTGYTWDGNRPGHCYENELPLSRLVARARARGANGAWFWSAHYR